MNHSILHTSAHSVSYSPHIPSCVVEAGSLLDQQPHLRSKVGQIVIELVDGGLVLKGKLPSYFLKQLAQETLRPLGLALSNQIRVG